MRKIWLLGIVALLAFSCDTKKTEQMREDVERKLGDTRKKAEQLTRQEREAYAKKIEREIDSMQERLDDLKRRHQGRKTNPGYQVDSEIKDLENKIADMRKRHQQILTSGEKQWQELQKRVDSTIEEIRKKLEKLSD